MPFGRLFSYKKNSFLYCQQEVFAITVSFELCLKEILLMRRFLTDVMHAQLDNTKA